MRSGIISKIIRCILCCFLPLLLLSGCGSGTGTGAGAETESGRELVIGFSQLGSESAWRLGNTASMEQAARDHGFSLMMKNGMQKQEKQIAAIRSFIAYQVDVIVFAPIVENGWTNVLQEARDAGIPVIMMDRVINIADSDLYDAYVGPDHYMEGVNAAKFLMRKAEEMDKEKIHIVELSGTDGSSPMLRRFRGFHDLIDNDDRFETLETVSGDFLRSKGRKCMEDLLSRYGDEIDVLYSHNDAMTLGAIEVGIYEFLVPENWIGHTIGELDIRNRYRLNILAVRSGAQMVIAVGTDHLFDHNQTVIALGSQEDIRKCLGKTAGERR